MNQYSPKHPGYPYSSPRLSVKRKVPAWTVCLIFLVCVVGGMLGCGSTSGNPRVGGTYGDFIAKYGQPSIGDGGNPEFYADAGSGEKVALFPEGQHVSVLSAQSDKVYYVSIWGPDTWTYNYTKNYCQQFLPVGSVIYQPANVTITNDTTLYQSSLGIISLQMNWNNGCDMGPFHP